VAQISNLLGKRVQIGRPLKVFDPKERSTGSRLEALRYSRFGNLRYANALPPPAI